jgi:Tfp pilus assembly protein PilX
MRKFNWPVPGQTGHCKHNRPRVSQPEKPLPLIAKAADAKSNRRLPRFKPALYPITLMKLKSHPQQPDPRQPVLAQRGFALVVTLSLMILLTVIAIGLLSLSSIAMRSTGSESASNIARTNARMALMVAIGELQKQTGPDQRVTLTSAIPLGSTTPPPHPNWTGAIDVTDPDSASNAKNSAVKWLVSGTQPDPTRALTKSTGWNAGDALHLGSYYQPGTTDKTELLAPLVKITQGTSRGRYAWWIGDEGTKARVDLAAPKTTPSNDREKFTRAQSPLEPGLNKLGATWKDLGPDSAIDKGSLISLPTTALAANETTIPLEYFNDLTTGGFGVPSNVVDGGMKVDLSLVFDKSQVSRNYAFTYFGANTPAMITFKGARIAQFTHDKSTKPAKDPKKFFLSDSLSQNGTMQVGPNWGNLWNYATLWQNVSGQQIPIVGLYPNPWSNLRMRDWKPYTNDYTGQYSNDLQHTNSSVTPVISTLQMGFRLKSQLVKGAAEGKPALYKAQVEIKPLIGIWNPYNVTIRVKAYKFDWAIYPFFRLNYSRPGGGDSRLTRLWLRREWSANGGSGDLPSDTDPNGGRYFSMETEPVDLHPGEFRMFSVTDTVALNSQKTHKLKSAWSEKGAFVVDLTYKSKDNQGQEVVLIREIPEGHNAWFGDIVLQDTFASGTGEDDFKTQFPGFDPVRFASTWFTFKAIEGSDDNVLFRSTELWNSTQDASVKVPEPVVSGWKSGATDNTSKEKFPIADISGEKFVPHIATWSFFSRTTTQLQANAANQRLRGWADTNPRTAVAMPLWDGSRVNNKTREGWNFNSNLIGGWHDNAPAGVVGDGVNSSPNRGLIGEGGRAEPEPQVSDIKRYAGFGGASNTATGQTNVIVYDVPRGPLVSIGQFQHAQLSRYNFEPGFIVGNSYANPRIPLANTVAPDFLGTGNLNIVDTAYEVNRKLWDKYFFSSLGIDYKATSGTKFDTVFNYKDLASGKALLPNPRMTFSPQSSDTSIDKIISDNGSRAPEAIASRILIKGAFNVNSTSKTAWKAVLSSMSASQMPTLSLSGNTWSKVSWDHPDGVRFSRFGQPISAAPYEKGASGSDPEFWRGWRTLTAGDGNSELDLLAEAIVEEVKARGPFRSMAEFVNRKLNGTAEQQRKGALQAALDRTVNNPASTTLNGKNIATSLPSSVGGTATPPVGSQFSAAISSESEAAGSASYLMQGDLLQSLAPIFQARSDYFRIRTCGEAIDASGKVVARAWCEAFVQRSSDYVDPQDASHLAFNELTSKANKTYGRNYRIVSFRWLNESEL